MRARKVVPLNPADERFLGPREQLRRTIDRIKAVRAMTAVPPAPRPKLAVVPVPQPDDEEETG